MKILVLIVKVFYVTILLSGCSLQQKWYRDYSASPLIPEQTDSDKYYFNLPAFLKDKEPSELNKVLSFRKSLKAGKLVSDNCADNNVCTAPERNSVAAGLMIVSDNTCNEHVKTIYGNDATYNLGLGTATNLFAGAATVAASSHAKTLFSAFALFSNAERSLINETVYKTILSTAIATKIKDTRKSLRDTLITNLDTKTITQYSFDRAVQDVINYHNSCSFMNGLELALQEGTQNNSANKRAILSQNLKSLTVEYDSRVNELKNSIKKVNGAVDENAFTNLKVNDPQLQGLIIRIRALNESLKKLESPDIASN